MRLSARQIALFDEKALGELPKGSFTLHFDDGDIETNLEQTTWSWYLWKIIRYYPDTPIYKAHHIQNERITGRTHLEILNRILWDCYDTYVVKIRQQFGNPREFNKTLQEREQALIEDLCLLTYQSYCDQYNAMSYIAEEYVETISVIDFLDITDHPVIAKANASLEPSEKSITTTHKIIKNVLTDPNELIGNPIAESMKSKLVSPGQVMQCVSAIGYRTDIDSNIFPEPILTSFTEGLVTLHDHAIESRSGSKALMLTKDPLRTAEYFNRKLQLATEIVQRINLWDCGSTTYLPFKVTAKDMFALAGKYYKTDKGLAVFKESDKHLIGRMIELRSVFHCKDSDPAGVCEVCFGQIAKSIPARTNAGHVSATVLCGKTTQNIMSTKHLDGSAEVDDMVLSQRDQKYIRTGKDNTILLNPSLKGSKIELIVSPLEASGLVDLGYTDDIRSLAIHNLTALTEVQFIIQRNRAADNAIVPVSRDNRRSAFTHTALEFIKKHGWTLTKDGYYKIDLSEWDTDIPLLKLPLKHTSTIDYVNSIEAKMIGLGKKSQNDFDMRPLSAYDNPGEALASLYDLVSSKLDVNIAHLELIVFSTLIRCKDAPDHSLPLPDEPFISGKYRHNMARRSLSAMLAYQNQRAVLYDPISFNIDYRPPHPLDDFIAP